MMIQDPEALARLTASLMAPSAPVGAVFEDMSTAEGQRIFRMKAGQLADADSFRVIVEFDRSGPIVLQFRRTEFGEGLRIMARSRDATLLEASTTNDGVSVFALPLPVTDTRTADETEGTLRT